MSGVSSRAEKDDQDYDNANLMMILVSYGTQQDNRTKCLCVTNETGLLLGCYVVIFT